MNGFNENIIHDLLDLSIERAISNMFYALPCKVKNYNKNEQKVEIDILVKFKRPFKEDEQEFQSIPEVPVGIFNCNGGKTYMSYPIKEGDIGCALFFTLDVDNYLSGNADTAVNSDSYGRQQLKDAIFIPIVRPWNKALTNVSADNVVIQNDKSRFEVTPDGTWSFVGKSSVEMLTEISNLMQHLLDSHQTLIDSLDQIKTALNATGTSTTVTALGPQPLSGASNITTAVTQITTLIDTLTSDRDNINTDKTNFDKLKA